MRAFLLILLFSLVLQANDSACYAAENGDLTIESDLVEIMDSFDGSEKGYNPNSAPKLSDILEAKGTLVFFDNSQSTGKKPVINRKSSRSPSGSNALQSTLERARQRLLKSENAPKKETSDAPVFSDRTQVRLSDIEGPDLPARRKLLSFKLDYDGEKTVATIPPNAVIEVPFLKHIPYFFSHIEILNDGLIKVTETIERVIEPKETNFTGIDRYFSKYYTDRAGKTHKTNLTVLEAFIDTEPVRPRLLPDIKGIRVSMHSKTPQPPGTHVYRITYLFSNNIAEFKNSDQETEASNFKELIWEVTGSHWDVPITRAGASIIFPPHSKIYSPSAITGGKEGYGKNFRIKRDKEDNLSFVLTFPLAPYEGLTVSANWSEADPSNAFRNGKLDRFITEYGTDFVAFIAFLFILSYYLATWFGQRKTQTKQSVKAAPLQKGDLTPAVLNYALKKAITPKSLFIILLGIASKGFLSFDEGSDGTLLLVKNTDKESGLTPLEKQTVRLLFTKDSTSFAMTNANILRLKRVMSIVEKRLTKEYRQKFTAFPLGYFWFGILMAVIAVASLASMSLYPMITALTSLACIIMLIPASVIGGKICEIFRNNGWKGNKKAIFKQSLAILPFLLCLTVLFAYYSIQTTILSAFFFFALLICIGVFKFLLRTPSSVGNSILENIEGYKLYLSSQDDTLLNVMRNAEFKIKSLYEKHLPFAVALDLDQLWTKRFVAFSEKENQLKPDWYKGKLPFTEDFVKALLEKFNEIFPKSNASQKSSSASRFKKASSNKR